MSMPELRSNGDNPPQKPAITSPFIPNPQQRKHWAKQYRTEIAASSSSLLSTFAAQYPLDSVKTRMQAYRFNHFVDCVQHTYKTEGFKGFWRGCLAPMASVTLVRTVSFSIYQKAKYTYSAAIGRAMGEEPLVTVNRPGSIPTLGTVLCFGTAGATAGGLVAIIACMRLSPQTSEAYTADTTQGPFELTKLSAQISVLMARSNTSGADDPVRSSYQQKGTFSTAKNIIMHRGIYPIDSAKTHYQRNCLTKAKGQPVKMPRIQFNKASMYRGLGVSMARSCLINTIFFSNFELIKKRINNLPEPGD
ncbi:MAG: hypothetical protein Q9211_003008 [Gyalolechia sp. 1 TL-2023]